MQKFKETPRERFLVPNELQALGSALVTVEREGTASPWAIAAIRLLILTGARLSEILNLRWDEVDLEQGLLRLSDSKTGRKTVYLNEPSIEILQSIPKLADNPYVICGKVAGQNLVNLQKPWRRIRTHAGLHDVRLHDLRHTFGSIGAMANYGLPVIGGLLGHKQPQTTQRYVHFATDPLKQAAEQVAGSIHGAMTGDGQKS